MIRIMPGWSKMTAVAPTLVHDTALTAPFQRGVPLPAERWVGATMPTLAIGGGKSPAWIQEGMRALTEVLPNATHRTLPGQTHLVKPKALGPVLVDFFGSGA
jgi:pimeloyl-ACP methyl ester carboxylesterase